MLYRYSKVVLFSNNYVLKKVQIVNLESKEFSGQDNSIGWNIGYYVNEKIKYVSITNGTESYNHFVNFGKKDETFGGYMMPKENEFIWIWHNSSLKDFYALGEKDKFNTKKYFLKTIFHLALLIIAVWSVFYQINYNKKRKNELQKAL